MKEFLKGLLAPEYLHAMLCVMLMIKIFDDLSVEQSVRELTGDLAMFAFALFCFVNMLSWVIPRDDKEKKRR